MKVIIVTETSQWGGLESHAVALARALCDSGHKASIVCIGQDSFELYRQAVPDAGFPIQVIAPHRRTIWGWWRAFRKIQADAAILEKGTLRTGGLALDAVLRTKFKRYITIQQLEPPELPRKSSARHFGGLIPGIGLWWYRWQLAGYLRSRAPQFTVCVSDAVKHALAVDYSFPERKLVTIHHGVDGRFRPDPEKRRQVRRAWGVPDDAFVFGSIRRFVWDKGLDLAVEAFAELMSRRPDCNARLVLIGDGTQQPALESLAERLGVRDAVIFPGFTPAPWNAYSGFDVFVIPSRKEALGVVVLEAMASGCFVIGSRVGGIPEMIANPSLGTLVPPEDSSALAAAMQDALTDKDRRLQTVSRARDHVATNFNLHSQCLKITALLE